MSRYSSIEWAGKAVRETTAFVLAVTEQVWNYGQMNEWKSTAQVIELLGVVPLVKAYNAVAEHHDLPPYAAKTTVAGLIGGNRSGEDQKFIRKEMEFIAATFGNSMQYMANNPGWQAAQDGMEKVALERLENVIRIIRCVSFSDMESRGQRIGSAGRRLIPEKQVDDLGFRP
jgi:hypothetical protein